MMLEGFWIFTAKVSGGNLRFEYRVSFDAGHFGSLMRRRSDISRDL